MLSSFVCVVFSPSGVRIILGGSTVHNSTSSVHTHTSSAHCLSLLPYRPVLIDRPLSLVCFVPSFMADVLADEYRDNSLFDSEQAGDSKV